MATIICQPPASVSKDTELVPAPTIAFTTPEITDDAPAGYDFIATARLISPTDIYAFQRLEGSRLIPSLWSDNETGPYQGGVEMTVAFDDLKVPCTGRYYLVLSIGYYPYGDITQMAELCRVTTASIDVVE